MPNALIPLPDVYESVTRRVAVDVAAQLARTMQLPGNTQVYLPGNVDTVPMNGGTFGDCCDPGVRYPAEARVVVRFTEEADEAHTLTTPVHQPEHMPIFHDTERDIIIRPTYRYVNFTVSIEYTIGQIVHAQRWLDSIRAKISALRAELYQTLEYHYALPTPALDLLKHLHEKMEASAVPTGLSFDEYLEKYLVLEPTTATTLIGTSPTMVFPEKQHEVLGWFDFTTTPQTPEKNDGAGTYTTNFSYMLMYNRPTHAYCKWPMLVHNRVIDRLYRPTEPYTTFKQVTRRVSTTKGSYDSLQRQLEAHGVPYIHHPETDDWSPPFVPKGRLTFFTGLLQISPNNPRHLIDISNLGDYTFTPYFLEYFYHQQNRLFSSNGSFFEFRVYENNTYRSDIELSFVPGTLRIQANEDLDLTKYYHIQISLVRNWYSVTNDALQCLRRYPTVAYTLAKALGFSIGGGSYCDMNLIGGGRPVPTPGDCPGEDTTIGDPAQGGQWPWPWLGEEWNDIAWPGNTWEGSGWPGGGWNDFVSDIPAWGHAKKCFVQFPGVIRNKDIEQARKDSDTRSGNYIDHRIVGPWHVMYGQIMSARRKHKE